MQQNTNMITPEALDKEDQVNFTSRKVSDLCVMVCSTGSPRQWAASSWGGNIKAGSAGKINNPGEKRIAVLLKLASPEAVADVEYQDKSELHLRRHLPTVCAVRSWEAEDTPEVLRLSALGSSLYHSHYTA